MRRQRDVVELCMIHHTACHIYDTIFGKRRLRYFQIDSCLRPAPDPLRQAEQRSATDLAAADQSADARNRADAKRAQEVQAWNTQPNALFFNIKK